MARRTCDRGQAFPVYIVAVAGLLFVALAFVVVGMAGNIRSEAQGAADAAALAAAREARDEVFGGLDLADLKPSDWEKILRGKSFDSVGACGKASSFAGLNDATATCVATPPEFTVTVITKGTIGSSVVPGTGSAHGEAKATALIKPRCVLGAAPTPSSPPGGQPPKPGPIDINCDGNKHIKLDPSSPGQLSDLARDLFSVRLVD
nr:pilus assembly protein TadG-related protein [Streptomyces sp. NBC_00974]